MINRKPRHRNRRTFISSLGRFATASPLAALAGGPLAWMENTLAQDPMSTPRALFLHSPGGAIADYWNPIGCETTYKMNVMSEPLEQVKYDCSFIADVHAVTGFIHNEAIKSLSSTYLHPTLDRYLAKHLGQGYAYDHLALGVEPISEGYFSNDVNGAPPYFKDAQRAFETLFGDSGRQMSQQTRNHLKVLDINLLQLKRMEANFAGEDLAFIQQRISDVEHMAEQLAAPKDGASACESPARTFEADEYDFAANARAQIDVAVLALKCGLTPVVSLQLGDHDGDGIRFPESGYLQDLRLSYEAGGPLQDYVTMRREMTRLVAYTVEQLGRATTPEGARLLDQIMMLHVSSGGNPVAHDELNAPYFFAGGALGRIATGKNVVSDRRYTNMDIVDTAAVAMGVDINNSDYVRLGQNLVEEVLVQS